MAARALVTARKIVEIMDDSLISANEKPAFAAEHKAVR
jgi:hypothetical protein